MFEFGTSIRAPASNLQGSLKWSTIQIEQVRDGYNRMAGGKSRNRFLESPSGTFVCFHNTISLNPKESAPSIESTCLLVASILTLCACNKPQVSPRDRATATPTPTPRVANQGTVYLLRRVAVATETVSTPTRQNKLKVVEIASGNYWFNSYRDLRSRRSISGIRQTN